MHAARVAGRISDRKTQRRALFFLPSIQRPAHRWKGDFVPRDVVPTEQRDIEAFGPGGVDRIARIGEVRPKDRMDLPNPSDAEQSEQAFDGDRGAGFFEHFPARAFLQRLAEFHVARRQCPKAPAGLDRAAAHQDAAFVFDDGADDDLFASGDEGDRDDGDQHRSNDDDDDGREESGRGDAHFFFFLGTWGDFLKSKLMNCFF